MTQALLQRVADHDATLNAFITVTGEKALAVAQAADDARAAGKAGALNGLPIVHKDIFCTRDVLTTCGSRMLENFVSPYDATVVERMADAGAVVLGKSNMDEFAMGSSNETSYFGPVKNPWDLECSPGGFRNVDGVSHPVSGKDIDCPNSARTALWNAGRHFINAIEFITAHQLVAAGGCEDIGWAA